MTTANESLSQGQSVQADGFAAPVQWWAVVKQPSRLSGSPRCCEGPGLVCFGNTTTGLSFVLKTKKKNNIIMFP